MSSSDMVQQLLPLRMQNVGGIHDVRHISALREWESSAGVSLPDSGHKKTWDLSPIKVKFEAVMNTTQNQADRARLIAVSSRHAGDFLNAFPSSAVGTRLDSMSLSIAVALRLGANVCAPHVCVCGEQVSADGTHSLTCRKSAGRHFRHNAVNDLIKRALASAETPAILEPASLSRTDGRQTSRRPNHCAVGTWPLFGVGLHLSRHARCKPPQQSCRGPGRCGYRRGRKGEVEVQQPVSIVRLQADCRWRLLEPSANRRWTSSGS